jgi:hypothetical protein
MFISLLQILVLAVYGKTTTDSHAECAIQHFEKVLLQKKSDEMLADGLSCMRRTHNISSVCKYYRCSAVVTMVHMHAEFVGPFGRHGRHFQTIKPHSHIVLSVYNVQENREAHRM